MLLVLIMASFLTVLVPGLAFLVMLRPGIAFGVLGPGVALGMLALVLVTIWLLIIGP